MRWPFDDIGGLYMMMPILWTLVAGVHIDMFFSPSARISVQRER